MGRILPGSILYGDVGSGKTLTALTYYKTYFYERELFVITTAKKRNEGDWEDEAGLVGIDKIIVDSWNNIKNYTQVSNAFFIFDEQRVVGYGAWTAAFIKITKLNKWILCTGTPGDTWLDYLPVFMANGFYRNKSDFAQQHIEYDRFAKYPKIKAYHNVKKLYKYREEILVRMEMPRHTVRHRKYLYLDYDHELYDVVVKKRWNPYLDVPIESPAVVTQCARRVVSESVERQHAVSFLIGTIDHAIIFYNYDYELAILRNVCTEHNIIPYEYNGHYHDKLPVGPKWVYLVQYTAGNEGWNCTTADKIIFYSMNYSYKVIEQTEGRIDRLNTKFIDLEYIFLTSDSKIDSDVKQAVLTKAKFNEKNWGDVREGKRIPRLSRKKVNSGFSRLYCIEERPELQAGYT